MMSATQADSAGRIKKAFKHHATGDMDFDMEEIEFLRAMEEFKRSSGKKFPTWTDALRVLRSLGWLKSLSWEDEPVEVALAG